MQKLARKRKPHADDPAIAEDQGVDSTQPEENLIGKKRRGKSPYTLESVMQSVALKLYPEQITGYDASRADEDGYVDQLLEGLKQRIRKLNAEELEALMGVHNGDHNHDDYWLPSIEKLHIHIILRFIRRMENGNIKRERLGTILEMLGVTYRPDIDRTLWEQHGVEAVGDFVEYARYLLHWTDKAKKDGKHVYELDSLTSNLSKDKVLNILNGHKRVSEAAPDENKKVQIETMIDLDHEAKQLGYDLQDFDTWYDNLPFVVRAHQSMSTIRESYYRGVTARAEDPTKNGVLRLCVFIQGAPDLGKTYAAIHALDQLGASVLRVGGGGTGKMDKLKSSHDAIVIDDDVCPNLLTMSDNYICQAYRRNRDNPYWCGRYLVVTSNLSFTEWLLACGFSKSSRLLDSKAQAWHDIYDHHDALRSRFYICKMDNGHLVCTAASTRGTYDEQMKRKKMFLAFQSQYNDITGAYKKDNKPVNYDDLIGH